MISATLRREVITQESILSFTTVSIAFAAVLELVCTSIDVILIVVLRSRQVVWHYSVGGCWTIVCIALGRLSILRHGDEKNLTLC